MYNYDENLFNTIIGGSIAVIVVLLIVTLPIIILYIIGLWKLFKKAGKNGWEAIIPLYNTYVLIEIAGLNWWYFLIAISGTIFAIVNIDGLTTITSIAAIAVNFFVFYNIAKKMNQSPVGYAVASIFVAPIITMVFGLSSKYQFDNSVPVSPNGPIGESSPKNEKYCLGCGCKLKSDTRFCENCGKEVNGNTQNSNQETNVNPQVNSMVQEKVCLGCGTKINSNDKFCQHCGKEIQ